MSIFSTGLMNNGKMEYSMEITAHLSGTHIYIAFEQEKKNQIRKNLEHFKNTVIATALQRKCFNLWVCLFTHT